MRYIMNHVQDVTESFRPKQSDKEQPGFSPTLRLREERSDFELLSCRQEIQELNRRLLAADAAQLTSKNSQLVASDSLHGVDIRGMRERILQLGGRVEINSNGQGTAVIARLPLASNSFSRPGTT
jgi:hypothetical protein